MKDFEDSRDNIRNNKYLSYIIDGIPGYLGEGNQIAMDYAIRNMPSSGAVFEIGSHYGLSTNVLIHLLCTYRKEHKIFNIDPWNLIFEIAPPCYGSDIEIELRADLLTRMDLFKLKTQFFGAGKLPYSFQGFSSDFFNQWESKDNSVDIFGREIKLGGPISFAYIDGNHDYEEVRSDFEEVDKYLLDDGLILLDDSSDSIRFENTSDSTLFGGSGSGHFLEGPNRLAKELLASGVYELVFKTPNYLLQKKEKKTTNSVSDRVTISDASVLVKNVNGLVQRWQKEDLSILIFGAGQHTAMLFKLTKILNLEIIGIVDSNAGGLPDELWSLPILSTEDIKKIEPCPILISSKSFQDDIFDSLKSFQNVGFDIVRLYS